ncbi:MAG: hypothetical protein WC839_03450 [Candidatus Paceibacterota bacterium]
MKKIEKDYYRRCSPYCFIKMPNGRYLGLNRDHLPLDRSRNDVGGWLDDSTYKNLLENANKEIGIVLGINDIKLLKHTGDENKFWLYGDKCAPWDGKKYQIAYDKKIKSVKKVKWLA